MKSFFTVSGAIFLLFSSYFSFAQISSLPPNGGNQKSVIRQYMGSVTYVEVKYSSPDVAGRDGKIWGTLVPYGKNNLGFGISSEENPSPWRAGANENTTIQFSHDMVFLGEEVKAGIYGLHLVPNETGNWQVILSTENKAWGSFYHLEEDEAYVMEVAPQGSDFAEYLTYNFDDRKGDGTTLIMSWENLSLPMAISVPNQNEITLQAIASDLKNATGFSHVNLMTAALWASGAGFHTEAGAWAEMAISAPFIGQRDFTTLSTKAAVLLNAGQSEVAQMLMDDAIKMEGANAFQIHAYGRQLIGNEMLDKALEVFKYNHKRYDGAWPTNYGLARGYSAKGDFKNAIKYLKLAQKNVPEGDLANPPVIQANLEKLEKGEDIN
jgi:tetratricopeptide (TPR) repeat protein